MDLDATMLGQECFDEFGLVTADVVADDVDLAMPGLAGDDVLEEGDELLASKDRLLEIGAGRTAYAAPNTVRTIVASACVCAADCRNAMVSSSWTPARVAPMLQML